VAKDSQADAVLSWLSRSREDGHYIYYCLRANCQNYSNQNGYNRSYKVGITFVYCDFQRWDQQKSVDILASLMKQLIQEQPSLLESIKRLYDEHKYKYSPSRLIDAFLNALRSVVSDYTRIFIIIDELDECHRSTLISKISNLQAQTRVNVFITSRPIQEIKIKCKEVFKGYRSLEISTRSKDVRKYLDSHMS